MVSERYPSTAARRDFLPFGSVTLSPARLAASSVFGVGFFLPVHQDSVGFEPSVGRPEGAAVAQSLGGLDALGEIVLARVTPP